MPIVFGVVLFGFWVSLIGVVMRLGRVEFRVSVTVDLDDPSAVAEAEALVEADVRHLAMNDGIRYSLDKIEDCIFHKDLTKKLVMGEGTSNPQVRSSDPIF